MERPWEDQISLHSFVDFVPEALESPAKYRFLPGAFMKEADIAPASDIAKYLELDTSPLPKTQQREGYCGERHFDYWLLGLKDYATLHRHDFFGDWTGRTILDIGCASGRVIRHFGAYHPDMNVMGCDINSLHVQWCNYFLPKNVTVFQNTSVPTLPLEDSSVDLITAYSVFSHIEAFETTWIAELRRVLKAGGVAYLTIHSDATLRNLKPTWPIYNAVVKKAPHLIGAEMQEPKIIFREHLGRSYASNVFLRRDYVTRVWGRFLRVEAILQEDSGYQDAVVLKKV